MRPTLTFPEPTLHKALRWQNLVYCLIAFVSLSCQSRRQAHSANNVFRWLLGFQSVNAAMNDTSFYETAFDPAFSSPNLLPRASGFGPSGARFSQGHVITDVGGDDDGVRAILLQTDGKVLAVGYSNNGTDNDFAMVRYGADGQLDGSFGTNGIVVTPFATGDSIMHAVMLDSQNRILVAGRLFDGDWDFIVSRYTSNGTLDATFGTAGHTQIDFGGSEFARGLVIDSLGRIIVGGYSNLGTVGQYAFAVARLLSTGALDNTFSGDGKATASFPGNTFSTAYAVLVDSSNRPVLGGRTRTPGGVNDFALARFTTAGALDNTFSGDGLHTQSFTTDDIAWAMCFDETERILLAGRSWNGANFDMRFARYTTAGVDNGSVGFTISQGAIARGIRLDEANRFVISGHVFDGTHWNFAVLRLLNTGLLDATFGTGGTTLTSIGADDDDALSLTYSPGLLHVAGNSNNGSDLDFALARYNINGTLALSGALDPYLNSTGSVTAAVGSGHSEAYAVAVQTDSKIIAAGYSNNGSHNQFTLLRYGVNGALDTTFNTTGILTTNVSGFNSVVNTVALRTDGRIFAAGNAYSGSEHDFAIARYHSNGILDTGFASTGIVTTRIGAGDDQANALTLDNQGRAIVVGSTVSGTAKNLAVVRYTTGGTLDAAFGTSGVVTDAFGNVPQWQAADQQINHGNSSATQLSVARPTNLVAGNLIIVIASVRTTTRPIPAPTGFTLIRAENGGGTDTGYLAAYYKIATASEPANYTMASNPGGEWFAISGRVTGNSATNPIGASSGTNSGTTSVTSLVLPSLTTTINNALLFAVWQNRNVTTGAAAASPLTQHWAHNTPRPATVGASQLITNAGATGTRSASWTGGERAAGLMFEIRQGGPQSSGGDNTGYAVVTDANNRIVVGGQSDSPVLPSRFGLMRLHTNGSIDTSFGTSGRLTTDVSGTWGAQLFALALDDNGKIVAVGRTLGLQQRVAIVRYNTNGSLDTSFNSNGILVSTISASPSIAYGAAITHNNKIVVTGTTDAPNEFLVARYLSNGSLDTSFASTGIVQTAFGSNDSNAHAIAVDPLGRIVAVGRTFNTNWNFATLRLFP